MAFQRNPVITADATFSAAGATAWNTQIFGVAGATVGGIAYFPTATSEAMSGMTWNASAAAGEGLAISAGTATTDVQALSLTQTWNNAAIAFTARRTNITNTQSAAGSLIEDWQVGGVSVASIGPLNGFGGGPQFKIGSGNAGNAGWILANYASGYSGIYSTGVIPGSLNYVLLSNNGNDTFLNGSNIRIQTSGSDRLVINNNGSGQNAMNLIAGTAVSDLQAISLTQTMNAAAVAFTGIKGKFTEGASGTAAGTSLIDLQYGTSGAESTMFKVSKSGLITTGGTAGVASFGPAAVASITVKNGIIVYIS